MDKNLQKHMALNIIKQTSKGDSKEKTLQYCLWRKQ
jgi:hypothetical protein